MTDQVQIHNSIIYKFKDLGDGSFAQIVVAVNPDGSAIGGTSAGGVDRECVVSTYRCKAPFTGASVGDTITATQILDVSGTVPFTVSTIWRNQTSAVDLVSVPSSSTVELLGSEALTYAQLASAGLATVANQATAIGHLATLAGAPRDRLPGYLLRNTEDTGAVKYVLKTNGVTWLMLRKSYTVSSSVTEYASVKNNGTLSETRYTEVWNARASINYSELSAV